AALPGTFYRRNESLPADMRYFDGRAPQTLRFGSPWPQGNFTWITKTTEVAPGFHLILLNGTWGVDLEVKEISLAIDTPDGIVLVVGCSHATIEKIVEAAKTAINKPIHLVLGGTHLLPAKDDQINSIAVALGDNWSVRYLAPVHCTGEPAFAILKETFGDRYIYAGLGTTVLLGPKVTVKAEAGQPYKNAMDEEDLRSYREAMMRGPLRGLLGGDKHLARVRQCPLAAGRTCVAWEIAAQASASEALRRRPSYPFRRPSRSHSLSSTVLRDVPKSPRRNTHGAGAVGKHALSRDQFLFFGLRWVTPICIVARRFRRGGR